MARVVELRRAHPGWGPRTILGRLAREGVDPRPGRSSVHRALVRHGLVEPGRGWMTNPGSGCAPRLVARATARPVCDALAWALRAHGVPEQVLTDNGKVFTARFGAGPGPVLFDRGCADNGIRHLLTAPY